MRAPLSQVLWCSRGAAVDAHAIALWPVARQTALRDPAERHALVSAALGGVAGTAFMEEVHGAALAVVERTEGPASYPATDALVTNAPGMALVGTNADCQMLVLHDPIRNAAGIAHIGWRGGVLGLSETLLAAMETSFGSRPVDLWAWGPPSLGPCCARFSKPATELPARWQRHVARREEGGAGWVDLLAVTRAALLDAGVRAAAIEFDTRCTACHSSGFPSHRREGAARVGTFLTAVTMLAR